MQLTLFNPFNLIARAESSHYIFQQLDQDQRAPIEALQSGSELLEKENIYFGNSQQIGKISSISNSGMVHSVVLE